MRRIRDPFPPTPEGFHLRVEQTLASLEERDMNRKHVYRRAVLLAAAILAALLMTAGVAAVIGNSGLRDRLQAEGANEAAELVQEVHFTDADGPEADFRFSIDELAQEGRELYVSYSLSAPTDGRYLAAMYTPTLNGEKLRYDDKGFTMPKFFDPVEWEPAVLLLGGSHDAVCSELWTFSVDPRLMKDSGNELRFRVVLLQTDLDLQGGSDWTDLMNPPDILSFDPDWVRYDRESLSADQADFMDAVIAAMDDEGHITPEALTATGHAEIVDEREIRLALDAASQSEARFNDVAEHDFDRFGAHIHIDRFTLTHLGVEIEYTASVPGAATDDHDAMKALNDLIDRHWHFCTADGHSLGYSLGGTGGCGWSPLADGAPAYASSWSESAFIPLNGDVSILFAPTTWVDDPDGGNHPVYDLENAIPLTPVYSEAVAEAEASATPEPDAASELDNWQRKQD